MGRAIKKMGSLFLFFLGIRGKERVDVAYRPKVTVIVPAYDEEKSIADTIKSIQAQTYPIDSLIVVDDCSGDKTGEVAQSLGATVIRTPRNTGTKAKAQNFALQHVNTDVVVTVDADTTLDPKAIEIVIPHLADGKTLSACGFVIPKRIKSFWEKARLVQYLYYIGLNKAAQAYWRVPLVSSGCFSAYNTKMLKAMGGFPEGTIVEDMVLTWRGHLEGKKTKFCPKAVCYPKDPSNWKQYKGQMMRWNRGFLQCIAISRLGLLKNIRLAFFVSWYLLSGIINPLLWGWLLWYLASRLYQSHPYFFLFFFGLFLEIIIVFSVVVIMGIRYKYLKLALVSFPYYWIIAPLDSLLFLNALIQEWLLGRKLQTWVKGH